MKPFLRFSMALTLLVGVAVAPVRAASYQVVVHASNPVESLSHDRLSSLFLKKVTRWDNGGEVQPVDLDDESSVRETFSRDVHGKDVPSIKSYWQKMIFSGRATPPPELSTDAEVLEFVRSNRGAVGYVRQGASVGSGVKVVRVER